MKQRSILGACAYILLSIATATATAAADPRSTLVVDIEWLKAHLDNPQLVLLHVGDADDYAVGHIAGARLVSLDAISVSEHTQTGLMLQMPRDEDLRTGLQQLGISDDSRIVVYFGQDWVSPSTRVVFTLQYAGLGERTSLLDGGMDAWVRSGGALSTDVEPVEPGKLAPLQTQPLIVDAGYLRAHLDAPGVAVVDARATAFFDGSETGGAHGLAHRTGHIRGARSIPYTEITDERLLLRSRQALTALFERAGVKPGDTVIGYCHLGQQATAMLFAARLLGHPVLLYDASFEDWSRHDENPVAVGAASSAQPAGTSSRSQAHR